MLDDRVRAFIGKHPDAVVVDLGAGLDSGYYRVAPPSTVDWYSVDLPGITALRDEVLPAAPQSHSVPVSLADEQWPDAIPADRPTMLVADGLFAFLTEAQSSPASSGASPTTSAPASSRSTTTAGSAG